MVTLKIKLEIIKQLFSTLGHNDKKSFLKSIKLKSEQNFVFTRELKECPHYKSAHFVKNGKVQSKQKNMHMTCHKTFTHTNNTTLYRIEKDLLVWKKYIHCMIEKYSLRKTAELCGISLPTTFTWRHKILDALQEVQESIKLDDTIKTNDMFMPISYKGHYKDFIFLYLAKKRENTSTKRGLSKELACIPYFVNFAKESKKNKEQILFNHALDTNHISQSISTTIKPTMSILVVCKSK